MVGNVENILRSSDALFEPLILTEFQHFSCHFFYIKCSGFISFISTTHRYAKYFFYNARMFRAQNRVTLWSLNATSAHLLLVKSRTGNSNFILQSCLIFKSSASTECKRFVKRILDNTTEHSWLNCILYWNKIIYRYSAQFKNFYLSNRNKITQCIYIMQLNNEM